ncbi:MAG: flagellar motor protein MotB [Roseiarcus sp.]|jgi:outer membrane protein OmpA-like peptidoglycan-associated protein
MIGRAVVLKRGNRSEAEKPFWISYADLMTALMVLFLVAMSVAMMTVTYNAEDVERQKQELEERNVQLNKALTQIETYNQQLEADKLRLKEEEENLRNSEAELKAANEQLEKLKKSQKELDDEAAAKVRDQEIRQLLNAVELAAAKQPDVKVNKDQHTIDFGDRARFEKKSNSLTPDQTRLLRAFVPEVLSIAKDKLGQRWLKQVVVEGFASPEGDYLYNLNLSLERSQRVLCALLAPPASDEVALTPDQLEQIRDLFLVGGFSFNAVKFDEATKSYDASRRVELRLEFLGLNETRPAPVDVPHERLGKCALPN